MISAHEFYHLAAEQQTNRLRLLAIEALKHWGVTGCEPELLKYRENAVYRVIAPDGKPAALRIHRYGYHSDAALRSELTWMAALGAVGIDVPTVIPAKGGSLFTNVGIEGIPELRQVDMLGWLDGNPLGTLEEGLNKSIGDVRAPLLGLATWLLVCTFMQKSGRRPQVLFGTHGISRGFSENSRCGVVSGSWRV